MHAATVIAERRGIFISAHPGRCPGAAKSHLRRLRMKRRKLWRSPYHASPARMRGRRWMEIEGVSPRHQRPLTLPHLRTQLGFPCGNGELEWREFGAVPAFFRGFYM